MKVLIATCGYRPLERLTHWAISELMRCPSPTFHETAQKPIAGPDVARSILATDFLNADYDAVLFLDDDVVFDPQDAVKLFNHVKQGKKVVGGCYVTKSEHPQPTSRFFDEQEVVFSATAEPVEIQYLAGGFMMVERSVIEKLATKLPLCNGKESKPFYPFFMPFMKRRSNGLLRYVTEYVTEDYAFCDRARDAGFKIWLDPSIRLGHVGSKIYELEDAFSEGRVHMPVLSLTKSKMVPIVGEV